MLTCLRKGIVRPGAIEREIAGLSTKMLNQRLRRFLIFGIAVKTVFPESPYHVEYTLTEFRRRFVGLIDMVDELQRYVDLQNKVSSPTALR